VSGGSLAEKIVAISGALRQVPHAFGGALALAYHAEPRATVDIDLNVFVGPDRFDDIAEPLSALGVTFGDGVEALMRRDGQGRAFWAATPIDVFFAYDRFHDAAAGATRVVPFADTTIRILSAEHLIVCKVVFNRPRDWVDIDAIIELGTPVDAAEVLRWVGRIAGDEDPRYGRIAALLTC
jgi:hypothetical protein